MTRHANQNRAKNRSAVPVLAWVVLVGTTTLVRPASVQTYVSAEPIPSVQIVWTENLAKIEGVGYSNLALWSQRFSMTAASFRT
jgi:hypothetical protein